MEYRKLGLTNESVSVVCLGGWHIGNGSIPEEQDAIRLMHRALDMGINFFDNAWDYNDGDSEERMGKALAQDGKREKVFLMTKNCERDFEGSMRNLEDSLRRLRTDHIDLWQFHEINYDNDPEWVFTRGGIDAAIKAREQGKVRFIGFTGHKDPRLHLEMLSRPFLWDACQMPINVMDATYRSFQKQVVPVCKERGIGVIGMKALGGGALTAKFLEKTSLPASECYRYALSQNVDSLVMGIRTMEQLEADAGLAIPLVTMGSDEQDRMLDLAREWAGDGRCEMFKSTLDFEGPHHRKQHGFA
jgi:aryl-alcohol dehydrogenase-like predicted oxidoreductase